MKKTHEKQKVRSLKFKCRILSIMAAGVLLLSGCAKDSGQEVLEKPDTADGTEKEETEKGEETEETETEKEKEEEKEETEKESVNLTVWGAEEDRELMDQVIAGFKKEYQDQADFQITYHAQSESGCKDALLGGLEEGADVFAFADDQLSALAAAGALEPVAQAEVIRTEHLQKAVEAASVGNTLYAYPLTADNGYFLYYNKEFFSEEDILSLENMLDIAADNGKFLAMDWSSAWYVYAFFGNTGMEVGLNEDGITNFCTWNQKDGEINGVDVAQSMLRIAESPGFSNRTDEQFLQGVQDGSVIAGVSGVWNAVAVEQTWGADMGAAKLPSYTCAGRQVQMASFSGSKLIGVNAYSGYPEWAAKLAEWIVSEQNQQLRFELRGQGPSNRQAAESAKIQNSPAIAALLAQSEYSQLQRVGGNFWEPVEAFAGNIAQGNMARGNAAQGNMAQGNAAQENMAQGNAAQGNMAQGNAAQENAAGEELQKQMDLMVERITAR